MAWLAPRRRYRLQGAHLRANPVRYPGGRGNAADAAGSLIGIDLIALEFRGNRRFRREFRDDRQRDGIAVNGAFAAGERRQFRRNGDDHLHI